MNYLRLKYQTPQHSQLPEESSNSQNGRAAIILSSKEVLVNASLFRRNAGGKLWGQITIRKTGSNAWHQKIIDGYMWYTSGTKAKGRGISWNGFNFPKTEYEVIFETGFTNKAWNDSDFNYTYQTAIVIGD